MKSMNSWALAAAVLLGFQSAVPPALAHHSGAGFNASEVKEITAVIKEFQFKNPHTWIQVFVTDENGQQQEWSVEWGSPNALARRGVRPSTFPPGAEVTMRIHPMANGSPAGGFVGAKFGDGTTIGDWDE
jgi:hypothetical protein